MNELLVFLTIFNHSWVTIQNKITKSWLLAFKKTNQNTQEVKYERFFNLDKTKVAFNKLTKRTDRKKNQNAQEVKNESFLMSTRSFSKLDLFKGGSFSPTICKSDIKLSISHISCFISLCQSVRLSVVGKSCTLFCLVHIKKRSLLSCSVFWFLDKTKQRANFRHTLPLTKRRTDR